MKPLPMAVPMEVRAAVRAAVLPFVALCLLFAGTAGATLVRKSEDRASGPQPGGVDVVPSGNRVRVQCWQDGRKIIDETDLAVVSLSIAGQLDGLRFRRSGASDGIMSVTTQFRTTCLLTPREKGG
ncbi:hypothetical protein [Azospirillum picis]|uniref:Uncharacterized protein n=1 Tax=Azospirillum picis TaxID=488438 RepID=A0ABU0MQ99_9PROT|nr:hypothetical protein [Azospirillum picis]MBP2302113.1 hypothetical protein [Azospirillum picis]MDQ0535596.1 hypothetical protein [Azospirillum picis]